jgi:hypothetical protein
MHPDKMLPPLFLHIRNLTVTDAPGGSSSATDAKRLRPDSDQEPPTSSLSQQILDFLVFTDEIVDKITQESPNPEEEEDSDVSVTAMSDSEEEEAQAGGAQAEAMAKNEAEDKAARAARAVVERVRAEQAAQANYDEAVARLDDLLARINSAVENGDLGNEEAAKLISDLEPARAKLKDALQSRPRTVGVRDDSSDSDSDQVYNVEVLLNRYAKMVNREKVLFYRVKWAGYTATSWEEETDIGRPAIEEYEAYNGLIGANHGIVEIHFYSESRGYRVSVEANKAVVGATNERQWIKRSEFVSTEMVDAFEAERASRVVPSKRPSAAGKQTRRDRNDSGSESNDEDDDGQDGASGTKLLTWDANRSEIRVSITKTLRDGNFLANSRALWNGILEFTITRLFLLEAVTPPPEMVRDDAMLKRVASAYYDIEEAAFLSNFKETARGPSKSQHKSNEIAYLTRRARRRWTDLRRVCEAERKTLRSYLAALRRIRSEADTGLRTTDDPSDDIQNRIVSQYRAEDRWWGGMHKPHARSTTQNTLMRYRSAETKRFLAFVRRQWYPIGARTDAARRRDTLGSPFSGKIPTSAQEPSVTVVDHTTPQLWFENSELVDVFAQAREDIVNTLPIPANENSKKGSSPIRFIAPDPDDPSRPDHSLFAPDEDYFSEARHAVCARRILYSFLAYGLITEQHDAHSNLRDQGPGCAYYALPRVRDHLLRTVRAHTAADHEQFVNVMTLFVFRTWNPLVANPRLLTDGEFAADYRELLHARLEGKTLLPELCGDAMRWAVSGFPN